MPAKGRGFFKFPQEAFHSLNVVRSDGDASMPIAQGEEGVCELSQSYSIRPMRKLIARKISKHQYRF